MRRTAISAMFVMSVSYILVEPIKSPPGTRFGLGRVYSFRHPNRSARKITQLHSQVPT
jgi:hypothetical protein